MFTGSAGRAKVTSSMRPLPSASREAAGWSVLPGWSSVLPGCSVFPLGVWVFVGVGFPPHATSAKHMTSARIRAMSFFILFSLSKMIFSRTSV